LGDELVTLVRNRIWPLAVRLIGMLGAVGLAGCAAIVIPMTAAEIGVGGFEAFKMYQTSNGGTVGVAFLDKDGKEIQPQPLSPVRRVAVWPENESQVHLAEKLMASKRFDVVTPGSVRVILLYDVKTSSDINELTEQERHDAFTTVCGKTKADMILVPRDVGSVTKSNALSFSSAKRVDTADLMAFSCERGTIVWRDQMTLVVEVGDKMPPVSDIMKVAGEAWADRVIGAETRSDAQADAKVGDTPKPQSKP
jgi:hypothetical protein